MSFMQGEDIDFKKLKVYMIEIVHRKVVDRVNRVKIFSLSLQRLWDVVEEIP